MSLSRFLRVNHHHPVLDMIEPNLYLSGEAEATNMDALKQHKITHILTINDYPLCPTIKKACPHLSTKFIMVEDMPSSDLLSYFDETYEFIREGVLRGAVLVHCLMGVSRSATIVIAYLMKKHRLSFREALDKVKAKRRVCPNIGFVRQLENYQKMGYSTFRQYDRSYKEYHQQDNGYSVLRRCNTNSTGRY